MKDGDITMIPDGSRVQVTEIVSGRTTKEPNGATFFKVLVISGKRRNQEGYIDRDWLPDRIPDHGCLF